MKGNARIIVFVGIVLFIIMIILLNMTVFTVKDVTVLNKVESQLIDEQSIISSSDIHIGSNIFAISEKKSKELIEVSHPYLMVDDIERFFPNKVVIHVSVRIPYMAIKLSGTDAYAVVDGSLKILDIIDVTNSIYATCTKVYGIEVESAIKGNKLSVENPINAKLGTIASVAENESLDGIAFLNFFESITFENDGDIVDVKLRSGVTICLKGSSYYEEKFRYALAAYRLYGEQSPKRTCGYIYHNFQIDSPENAWNWSEEYPYKDNKE